MAMISAGQLKMIWALARKNGMDSEDLHARVAEQMHCNSIKSLTMKQAAVLIDALGVNKKTEVRYDNRVTDGQIAAIKRLFSGLGWEGYRQVAWLEKRYGVSRMGWLTHKNARNCIEALKAIQKGGRAERENYKEGGKADGDT